ncbi:MAG: hypothetical protein JWQ34_310 [Mucilaginibacter sp.]|uniref:hypothetical protein n=1 Tax=Mucilaginibacter sp. TaxID=1882438 RepID=UPI00261F7C03|nr:hypothetical protein [Mucilaginibacter sp.]MDB5002085.1 hypothetical protein [Mucilaginibacter sp.]
MKVKFYFFSIILLCGIGFQTWAQVSYNKRTMGNIGNAPKAGDLLNGATLDDVDKSTGTLKINIPLYEIKVNDISVPISLNYSALGIKVGQEAGVAGMGWELNAGGKIITNIQGKPDYSSTLNNGISSNNIPDQFSLSDPYHLALLKDIIDGKKDNAWDNYTYILPNGGGTYMANGLTFPYDPLIKIDHANSTISTTDGLVYNFTTGDAKKTTKIINYSTLPSNVPAYDYLLIDHDPAQWFDYDLKSITSRRFKDVVNFKYKHIDGPYYIDRLTAKRRTNVSETLPLYRDVKPRSDIYGGGVDAADANSHYYTMSEPIVSKSVTEYIAHTVLDTIDFSTGMVVFDYLPTDILGRDVLQYISIFKKESNNTLSLLKKYRFEYWANHAYGHYLYKIDIYDSKGSYQNCWNFGYNDFLPVVPDSNSKAQDRWGFYNGATTNKTLLEGPTTSMALNQLRHYPINGSYIQYTRQENREYYGTDTFNGAFNNAPLSFRINFANREPAFGSAIMGTLANIATPLGAIYEYNFESHYYQYVKYVGTPGVLNTYGTQNLNGYGGGIRIQSITKRTLHSGNYYGLSNTESSIKKVYQYGTAVPDDNPSSSTTSTNFNNNIGQVTIPYTIVGNVSTYFHNNHYLNDPNPDNYDFIKNLMMLSHPINNLMQYNGSYVMYKSVTESPLKSEDGTDNHGQTTYYSNLPMYDPFTMGVYNGLVFPNSGIYNPYTEAGDATYDILGYAPYFSNNAGITTESGAGVFAVNKFAYNSNDGKYYIAERTKYDFQFFPAPQNSTYHLMSMYAAQTGSLSGAYPTNVGMPILNNPPVPTQSYQAGAVELTFENPSSAGVGTMDYTTKVFMMEQSGTEDYPNKYIYRTLDLNKMSYCIRKIKENTTTFGIAFTPINDTYTRYWYENPNHMLPTKIAKSPRADIGTNVPPTDTLFTRINYPNDYTARFYHPATAILNFMDDTKMGLSEHISEITFLKTGNPAVEKIIGGTVNTFMLQDGNAVVPEKVYKITPPDNALTLPPIDVWHYTGIPIDNNVYRQQMSYDLYAKGHVHQYTELTGKSNVILWGYKNQLPIAKVNNAGNVDYNYYTSADVAYTSFEARDTCNWLYGGTILADSTTISSKKVYDLSTGPITKVNTTASGTYIVSYWYKSGALVTITGGTVGAAVIKTTHGPWVLAEQEISAVTGVVTVSGTGYIDELRFHPKDAQMTTYLYDPLIGLTCTIDANGRAQYYEYDDAQRLKQIRDHKGNLVKAYKYILGTDN